ncbi:MAG: hypothetical protein IJI43_03675 [Bacilli bacterium]|nr:hypothetical protein [Bacilli bacterium]
MGFSALNQNLNISGDVEYEDTNIPTLYNVLREETELGTYAQEYTGEHQDSMNTALSTEKIYYWYASNDTNATTILDKWNVIFGGFCWQMLRTTDTGGVKLIYNGIATDGTCNNTGTAQQIGQSKFNSGSSSPAYVGYMYNKRYISNSKYLRLTINVLSSTPMTGSLSYYYGTGITYSNGTYTLTGPTQDTWSNTYSSSSGLYTCMSTTDTTCSTVYYIAGGTSSYMYGFEIANGNFLNYYNTNITFGTSYTESNGTYTLTGTTTVTKLDYYRNYSTYKTYYTCGDDSTTCTDLNYITSTSNYNYYSLSSVSNNYIYAKDFTYNSGTDTYTLGSDRYEAWELTDTDKTNFATHHYTCLNNTGTCQTLLYVYYVSRPTIYYLNLTGGKSVEDALDEMLYDDNVNERNSDIKAYIDNWYQNNMTSYTSYLEDTIFCYNRVQSNATTNEWNPDGGDLSITMHFKNDSLNCTNDTDKFSVSNNKAKLTYPVGLVSQKEMSLLNNNNLRKIGQYYWLGSPYAFTHNGAIENFVYPTGITSNYLVYYNIGVRPVVSLKPDTEYSSGTGSKDDPYVVE